jgi:hypothetical protein
MNKVNNDLYNKIADVTKAIRDKDFAIEVHVSWALEELQEEIEFFFDPYKCRGCGTHRCTGCK